MIERIGGRHTRGPDRVRPNAFDDDLIFADEATGRVIYNIIYIVMIILLYHRKLLLLRLYI